MEQRGLLDEQEKQITDLEKLATTYREIGRPASDVEEMITHLRGMHRVARKMLDATETASAVTTEKK
jgi:hypothetical protein